MFSNDKSIDKSKVSKCRSTSNILKLKIGIALGRDKQVHENSINKKSMAKGISYLGKQRSMSLKSLSKTAHHGQKKEYNVLKRKSSFNDHELNQKENLPLIRNLTSQSVNSAQTERPSNQNSNFYGDLYQNLIWIDPKNKLKLKIIRKNIMTLGNILQQNFIEYCVQSAQNQFALLKIIEDQMIILSKQKVSLSLYHQNSKKKQNFSRQKLNRIFPLNLNGYYFIFKQKNQNKQKINLEMFDFLIEEIKKLNQDGLKDFNIVSKIVKRIFQSKFQSNINQDDFFLLIKTSMTLKTSKQAAKNDKKEKSLKNIVVAAQQLIAQKLGSQRTIQTGGKQHSLKIKFNKKH